MLKRSKLPPAVRRGKNAASQFSLFAVSNEDIIDELRELTTDKLSPEEAKKVLSDLKARII